jgi:hypothetical protein
MKVSFLISAMTFLGLRSAAGERGWRSDPDYAERTVRCYLDGAADELDGESVANLAAMCGEFQADRPEEIVRSIGRFFGERPPRLEVEGVEYATGRAPGPVNPLTG